MQTAAYDKALSFFGKGNYRKAGRLIDRVIKSDRKHANAHFLKGRIALEEHNPDSAEWSFNKAIEIDSDNAGYLLSLAVVLTQTKEMEKAASILERCLDMVPADDTNAQTLMADLLRLSGSYTAAYNCYKRLRDLNTLKPMGHFYLVYCLKEIQYHGYSLQLEEDVLCFLRQSSLEHDQLSRVVCCITSDKYHPDGPTQTFNIDSFCQDELVIRTLKQVNIRNIPLEQLVIEVRRELLLACLEQSALENKRLELVIAIAEQSLNSEYIFLYKDDEEEMLTALEEYIGVLVEQEMIDIPPLSCAVIVIAMYKSVYEIKHAGKLIQVSLCQWPEAVRQYLKRGLYDIDDEITRAANIPALTPIKDPISQSVQAQYEDNPYPRWIQMTYVEQVFSLQEQIRIESTSTDRLPAYLNNPMINVLIAGCGTGRQPLQFAKVFNNTNVLAVDLSRRSLAYAQRMAEHYEVNNVRFLHADILDLGHLNERFHVICCNGVLHHMQEPLKGWEVLTGLLVDKGLMKISLYSEIARQVIVEIRKYISDNRIDPSPQNIRMLRQAIITGQFGEQIKHKLTGIKDLHSISSCRDLLFHVQEHRFTLPQLQQSLQTLNLRFMGFNIPVQHHYHAYMEQFPDDKELTNLGNWDTYEQQNPDTFITMYQFWCQLRA